MMTLEKLKKMTPEQRIQVARNIARLKKEGKMLQQVVVVEGHLNTIIDERIQNIENFKSGIQVLAEEFKIQ